MTRTSPVRFGRQSEMPDDIRVLGITLSEDPLERLIMKHIYGLRAERRIYPDTYAAELAAAIREELSTK